MNSNLKPRNVGVHREASGYTVDAVFSDGKKDIYVRCRYSDSGLYDDWHSENCDAHDFAESRAVGILESEFDRLASGKVYPGESYYEY